MTLLIFLLLLILFSVSPRISTGTGWVVGIGLLLITIIVYNGVNP